MHKSNVSHDKAHICHLGCINVAKIEDANHEDSKHVQHVLSSLYRIKGSPILKALTCFVLFLFVLILVLYALCTVYWDSCGLAVVNKSFVLIDFQCFITQ